MVGKVATSKHLCTTTELTLVAPIRQVFVATASNDSVAVASRLLVLLEVFFELRRAGLERSLDRTAGPLERLRTLHNFSWSVFDRGQKLLLAVTFDRPWEPYMRAIVDQAGPFLDVIFCHCEGYDRSSTDQGYVAFAEWVRRHQVDVSLFYSAEPDMTVDDQRYLRAREGSERDAELGCPPSPTSRSGPGLPACADDQRLARAAAALVALRQMFHAPPGDAAAARARTFFDRAAWLLLEPIAASGDGIGALPPHVARATNEMRAAFEAPRVAARLAREQQTPLGAEDAERERQRVGRVVQGNILSPYPRMTHGCAALLGFADAAAAQAFAARLAKVVTTQDEAARESVKVNVALTFQGFRTLGLTEDELARFPIEFREGMAARAGLLGDVGPEHPDNWAGPLRVGVELEEQGSSAGLAEVDMLLVLQRQADAGEVDWGPGHPLYSPLRQLLDDARGVRIVSVLGLQREFAERGPTPDTVLERFGYADGVSQPVPSLWASNEPASDRVALGEVLIGYPGDRGAGERYPTGPDEYTRDGSFLVVRQLEQDVEAFEAFIDEYAGSFSGGRDALYTLLMGRQRDGWSPLSPAPGSVNDFDYAQDSAGERCPLISHVRRSNPREPASESVHGQRLRGPRITRRGFSYGPFSRSRARGPRGLLFMAYNASVAEQFEVIQRWLNGANSTGMLSAHADPIVSHRPGQVLTLPDRGELRTLVKKQAFVKLVWGGYFFAPSKPALQLLSRLGLSSAEREAEEGERRAAGGKRLVEQLQGLGSTDRSRALFAWKRLLEDRFAPDVREDARAVWAFIRGGSNGVLRTPYGVLVGTAEHVRRVLGDEAHFSVCEYGRRMADSVGLLYLGVDRCPVQRGEGAGGEGAGVEPPPAPDSYRQAAELPNAFMASISRERALAAALGPARRHFERLGPFVELLELAKAVVSEVSREWFGLPRDRRGYEVHHTAALSIFSPHPEPVVRDAARALGAGLEASKSEALRGEPPELAKFLGERGFTGDVGMALVGGAQGTLAATVGSFVSVASHCLEGGRLGRLTAWLATPEGQSWRAEPAARERAGDDAPIVREVRAALCARPAPDLLHRTVIVETELGGLELERGERVVVSLSSALACGLDPSERAALPFGGEYPAAGLGPKHPCPGREAALGVILALLLTLLEHDVRSEGALRVSRRG